MEELENAIQKGEYALPGCISSEAQNLLTGMLNINPSKRITIPEICAHPWMSTVDNSFIFC